MLVPAVQPRVLSRQFLPWPRLLHLHDPKSRFNDGVDVVGDGPREARHFEGLVISNGLGRLGTPAEPPAFDEGCCLEIAADTQSLVGTLLVRQPLEDGP